MFSSGSGVPGSETKIKSAIPCATTDDYKKIFTEYKLSNQTIRVEFIPLGANSDVGVIITSPKLLAEVRRRTLKRYAAHELKKPVLGEKHAPVDIIERCREKEFDEYPELANPFRFFRREHIEVTHLSHRVYARILMSDRLSECDWMTPQDITNELHILQASLEKLYGAKAKNGVIHANSTTIAYGISQDIALPDGCYLNLNEYDDRLFLVAFDNSILKNDKEVASK